MPHLVEMHRKHAKDGLVVITVALDPKEDDPDVKDRIVKFLKAKQATFTNLWLDEPLEFWTKKFDFVAPPAYFVFDRNGKWTRFRSDEAEIDYAAIDKLVVELLREK